MTTDSRKIKIPTLKYISSMFDLGVTILVGDDGIEVVGRDSIDDEPNAYKETTYAFDLDSDVNDIALSIEEARRSYPDDAI